METIIKISKIHNLFYVPSLPLYFGSYLFAIWLNKKLYGLHIENNIIWIVFTFRLICKCKYAKVNTPKEWYLIFYVFSKEKCFGSITK